jgi:hypothetical protein
MKSKIICLLLFFMSVGFADTIETHNGEKHDGIVIESTSKYVKFQLDDSTYIRIVHDDIKSIFFTFADAVYLLSKQTIKCKILEEIYPQLKVITSEGIKHYRYNEIKRYFYNDLDSLYITSLPPTTYSFNNDKIKLFKQSTFSKNIFVGIRGGINSISIKEWEDNFLSSEAVLGFEGGIKVGYSLFEKFNITLGYEYGRYRSTIQGDLENSFNTNFIYLSPSYLEKFVFSYIFYAGLALDVGLFKSNGNLYLYSYRNIDIEDQAFNIAVRPKIILRFPVSNNFLIDLDAGYLFAKSNEIDIPVKSVKTFPVSFNSFSLKFSVCYQFPYSF